MTASLSLKSKIILAFLLAQLTISSLVLAFSYHRTVAQLREKMHEDMLVHAYVYQQTLINMLRRNYSDGIQESIALQGANIRVARTALLDDDLNIVSSIHPGDKGRSLASLLSAEDFRKMQASAVQSRTNLRIDIRASFDGQSLMMLAPLAISEPAVENVSTVRLHYYFQQRDLGWIADAALQNLMINAIPVIAVMALCLLLMYVFLQRTFTGRLITLSRSADSFETGIALPLFIAKGNDEIGHLGMVLNQLVTRIATEQQKLTYEKQRLEYIQHTAKLGSFVYNHASGMVELSAELCSIFGIEEPAAPVPLAQLIGAVSSEDRRSFASLFHHRQRTLDDVEFEFRFIHQQSHKLCFGFLNFSRKQAPASASFMDAADEQVLHLGSIMDITNLQQAVNTLRKNQLLNQKIIDNVPECLMTLDSLGHAELVNKAAVILFEHPKHLLRRKSLAQLVELASFDNEHDDLASYLDRITADGMHTAHMEVPGTRSNGVKFPARASLTRLGDRGDANDHKYLFVCTDISSLLGQQQQQAFNDKMVALGQLSGGIAHDFNNIISVILGYADLLQAALVHDTNSTLQVGEIIKASERARTLTSNLLSYTKPGSHEPEACEIAELLDGVAAMTKVITTSRIAVVMNWPSMPCRIKVDPHGFVDMVLNLGINAIHAMPGGGTLTIGAQPMDLDVDEARHFALPDGAYVQLIVSDTGIGMDEHTQRRIFEPFFSTKGKNGTGLGLAQVYNYLQKNRASVKVLSTPGKGTSFRILFPRLIP